MRGQAQVLRCGLDAAEYLYGVKVARTRLSTHKREREYQKRQRELLKAEKAARKRDRRQHRAGPDSAPTAESADRADGSTDPSE